MTIMSTMSASVKQAALMAAKSASLILPQFSMTFAANFEAASSRGFQTRQRGAGDLVRCYVAD